jgi:tetratricopeptide (TPR) repeat protein
LAYEALSEFWPDLNQAPVIDDLDELTGADVIHRAGALAGWLGSISQTSDIQERGKNLLTQSVEIFEQAGQNAKAAEARGDLALCYWREGAFDEARINLASALNRLGDEDSDLKAILLIRAGIIEERTRRLQNAMHFYDEAEPLVESSDDHGLKGAFHAEYGLVFRRLAAPENREDYLDRALIEYARQVSISSRPEILVISPMSKTISGTYISLLEDSKTRINTWIEHVTCSSISKTSAWPHRLTILVLAHCSARVAQSTPNALLSKQSEPWSAAASKPL